MFDRKRRLTIAGSFILLTSIMTSVQAEDAMLVPIKRMTLDTAMKIAKGAIDTCRKEGVQVAVTVVDRGGHPQVVLRDVLAMDLSLDISRKKAYTAMSFNTPTSGLKGRFKGEGSIASVESVLIAAGGLPVQAGGQILGGVGVSGAPSGKTDEKCAKAGIAVVQDDLDMAD